ncbi:MAG TPA: DUF6766 family protein [Vicinamibacterales bacterium]|nr:DUF6766 family protein [Vicinamibacterales bacterium]
MALRKMPDTVQAKDEVGAGIWRRHGLSLALLGLTLATFVGLIWAGTSATNGEREAHGEPPLTIGDYVRSPEFVSATFENWESEFLQMGVFVVLSVVLRQKGSAESRPLDPAGETGKRFPEASRPWPVTAGGIWLKLYENSLSLAFFVLFALSFVLHLLGSAAQYNDERTQHGEAPVALSEYLTGSQFWFESLQNWQSEFLAVLAIVVLSIHLRQKDSPQSKQVDAPHEHTGH